MVIRGSGLLPLLAGTVLLIAGCSEEAGGDAEPEGSDSAQQQGDVGLPHSGAPAVENPIEDTSAFEADICSVLTERQLNRLEVQISEADPEPDNAIGPTCRWRTETRDESFSGSLLTTDGRGLTGVYAEHNKEPFDLFEEWEPVGGQPAVVADYNDGRADGYCNIEVGLRDDLSFHFGMSADVDSSPYHDDPCGAAYEIAGMAVETIKGDQ